MTTPPDRNDPPAGEPTAPAPASPPAGAGAPLGVPRGGEDLAGTPQDVAARPLSGLLEVGTDNIREGRGDVQSNPALAEGGEGG